MLCDHCKHDELVISIHAPSRERLEIKSLIARLRHFNPRSLAGATVGNSVAFITANDFNPRSLAGATEWTVLDVFPGRISIHAPSRERRSLILNKNKLTHISIHAPSRERP